MGMNQMNMSMNMNMGMNNINMGMNNMNMSMNNMNANRPDPFASLLNTRNNQGNNNLNSSPVVNNNPFNFI